MRYNKIRKMDISNGPGIRVSIFLQGCEFKCEECFNKETWDFNGGKEFDEDVIRRIIELADHEYIVGLSILGGEPMHPKNIKATEQIAKAFKARYPHKTIWSWTGFLYEGIKDQEALKYIDVLIDGQFNPKLYSPLLKWRGSSNQRVIDVPKSLKNKKIVTIKDEDL